MSAIPKDFAYHFLLRRENGKDYLRDGEEAPPDGVWLEYDGPLVMCKSGLHFSRDPFDALKYAPGGILCLVEIGGEIIEGGDKGVCSRRKIIRRFDATEGLRYFARMQALSVVDKWGAPDVLLDYLMTGDEGVRVAARDAAWAAARDAAWDAAWDATRAAAWDAARAAARAAARDAAWAAAWAAAWDAARDAARAEWNALVAEAFSQ